MQLATIDTCPQAEGYKETGIAELPPFTPAALPVLLRSVPGSDELVTILQSPHRAQLQVEEGVLVLTAAGRRFTYALRIMNNCVHATVRDRGSNRVTKNSGCLMTTRAVSDMLESIQLDMKNLRNARR